MRALVQLRALVRKELRQTFRDPRMVWMLVGVPVLQLVLFGYAVNLDVDALPTVLCDEDRTPESRDLAAHFFADRTFAVRLAVDLPADAERALARDRLSTAVFLPRGLGARLRSGRPAEVQVLIDGTDPVRARVAGAAAEQFFLSRGLALGLARLEEAAGARGAPLRLARVTVEPRILYNPMLRSPPFMVPGVVGSVLLIVTTLVTAMGIARERETGTLEQVVVAPLPSSVYLLGKILPFLAIGLVDVGLVLGAGIAVFDVPMRGSLLVVYAGALVYLLATLGIGLFISTLARTQQQAILAGAFFVIPAVVLSGFMSPVESMPTWIQPLSYVDPMYYFVRILRATMLKGAGFADCARDLGLLALVGAVVFTLSVLRFRRRSRLP